MERQQPSSASTNHDNIASDDEAPAPSASASPSAAVVVVDRTLHPLLTTTVPPITTTTITTTPSSQQSITPQLERHHRLHGSSLLQSAGQLLNLPPSTVATSCTIFHRYYHRVSLTEVDVWTAALGCVVLAGKVEECPVAIRNVVIVFHHLYRRRRLGVGDGDTSCYCDNENGRRDIRDNTSRDNSGSNSNDGMHAQPHEQQQRHAQQQQQQLTTEQRTNLLRYVQPMPSHGPTYEAWSDALLSSESSILRQLGFTLYWIPDHHPHKFILYFLRVLGLDRNNNEKEEKKVDSGGGGGGGGSSKDNGNNGSTETVAQKSWNYCNDSCLLDVCVRYEPEVIACASIILATSTSATSSTSTTTMLPMQPRPWWEVFIGPDRDDDLIAICNAVLGLGGQDDDEDATATGEIQDAMRGYVPSLVEGGSFTDPGSYLWHNCGI